MNKPLSMEARDQHRSRSRANSQQRIEPLATLPVFWKLSGQPALVVGASDAAAWKAELLAAAGADVVLEIAV